MNYKFKRNESFYIRDGWFEKAIHTISENASTNIFYKNNGVEYLGIGSNMVKSLKYWLTTANIITINASHSELSDFGKLILKYDPYLESSFVWYIIHQILVLSEEDAPIFSFLFSNKLNSFKKDELSQIIFDYFKTTNNIEIKKDYIDDDLNICVKSYINEDTNANPEDNYICPLSSLNLLTKKKDVYIKNKPFYSALSYLNVYYLLSVVYKFKPFNIEDCLNDKYSPINVFNLDKNSFLQYLNEIQKNELIRINKTAGLNTVYFEKKMNLKQLFNEYFGG